MKLPPKTETANKDTIPKNIPRVQEHPRTSGRNSVQCSLMNVIFHTVVHNDVTLSAVLAKIDQGRNFQRVFNGMDILGAFQLVGYGCSKI